MVCYYEKECNLAYMMEMGYVVFIHYIKRKKFALDIAQQMKISQKVIETS